MNDLEQLKKKILSGMAILIARDFGMKFIAIFGQIILVKLVAPEYFGLFAIFTFIVSIAELFTDLGLTQSIIRQKAKLTNEQLSTILFVKLFLSTATFILLVLLFPLFTGIYHQIDKNLFYLFAILSSTLIFKSIKTLQFALFDRDLNFSLASKIDLIGIAVYFVIAISLAFQKEYLANFIYAIFAKELIECILSFYYKPWKPKLNVNFISIKPHIHYGFFLQIGSIFTLIERSIIPIVGFRLNSYSIGLLDWSLSISNLSNTVFENYGRVAFVGIAKIQKRLDKVTIAVNKSINFLNIFSFLFIALLLNFSKEVITIVFSEKWIPALPALYWYLLSLVFFSGSVTIAHALLALGKSKIVVIFSGVDTIIEILFASIFLNYFGFWGIALGTFLGSITQFIGYLILARKHAIHIDVKNSYIKKLCVFILTMIAIFYLNQNIQNVSFFLVTAKIFIATCIYFGLLFIINRDDIIELVQLGKGVIKQ